MKSDLQVSHARIGTLQKYIRTKVVLFDCIGTLVEPSNFSFDKSQVKLHDASLMRDYPGV